MVPYTELHTHSNFSFLEGASHIEELVLRARELGLRTTTACTGRWSSRRRPAPGGLRPITGAEVTLDNGRHAWLPDGSRIAFASDRDGNAEIYAMSADGSGETNITSHAAFDHAPAWSPVP